MKLILTILFLYCFTANATVYYVSNAGSDGANGTSTGTSWQTIAKVNASSFSAGDQILFKAGDSWNEMLNPPSSGSAGNVITFGSYGAGAKPLITGFQTLTGFTNVGNIWSTTFTNSAAFLNTVLVNGVIKAKGRYPNTSTLTFSAPYTDSMVISSSVTGTNYVGAEVVVKTYGFIYDVGIVTYQNNDTLKFLPKLTYPSTTNQFFIQNAPSALDLQGEWCINYSTKLLSVYSTTSPTVQGSTLDTLASVMNKNYITFDGLSFQGANVIAIRFDTSDHFVVRNCTFNNTGQTALYAHAATNFTIENDSIQNSLNNGTFINRSSSNNIIQNNYIKNSGIYAGMGANGNGAYIGMLIEGDTNYIYNNRIFSSGYCGRYWTGKRVIFEYNWIDSFCIVKNDGAGDYTVANDNTGSIVKKNIITNGIGQGAFTTAAGIYPDNGVSNFRYDSNTVSNCNYQGVLFHYPSNIGFHDNTIVNGIGYPFYYALGGSGNTFNITRNIFYSKEAVAYNCFYTSYGSFTSTTIDSNYNIRPLNEAQAFRFSGTQYDLAGWRVATGWETNGVGTVPNRTSDIGVLYINPTLSDSTISLAGNFINAKGVRFTNSITIAPFQSQILFPATALPTKKRVGNLIFY